MDISYRPTRLSDLETCFPYIRDAGAYTPEARAELLEFWQGLLKDGAGTSTVMIDRTAPQDENIVFFGIRAFITPEFRDFLVTTPSPGVALQAMKWRRSGRKAILDPKAVRAGNRPDGEGLILVCMNSGGPAWASAAEDREAAHTRRIIRDKQSEWIVYSFQGYHLKEYLFESYDDQSNTWALGVGLRLRNDYGVASSEDTPMAPGECYQPRLYGISREEADSNYGCLAAPPFNYRPPRFRFKPEEQTMFMYAISGWSDDEIAQALNVSLPTIKKRFIAAFEHVQLVDPGLLPSSGCNADQGEPRRGPVKRRRLLQYLRNHLEELRPHAL